MQNLPALLQNPYILFPIMIWTVVWKGLALWRCGRNNQLYWFVALLVINTVGLLDIVYLVWFKKNRNRA